MIATQHPITPVHWRKARLNKIELDVKFNFYHTRQIVQVIVKDQILCPLPLFHLSFKTGSSGAKL